MKNMYETDDLMRKLFTGLYKDMACCTKFEGNMQYMESVEVSRTRTLLLPDNVDAYTFKWTAQLSSFLKRYTFKNDLFTPAQREEVTNAKFVKLQESLATVYSRQRSTRLHRVLCHARSHTRRILSGFSPKEIFSQGQFGTKATIGCPAAQAYIDEKLCKRPITGSAIHLQWFKNDCLSGDPLLDSILRTAKYEKIRKLKQVNVPKKFSIDRGINPNTLIGSYYSSGLGRVAEDALRKEGLDIRRLQKTHESMMEYASYLYRTKGKLPKFVTADLSDASHGFLSHHLNALLPREWYHACMKGALREVEVNGSVIRLESIMTMGIGFTFPMQTLLFYCLLLALRDLTGIRGRISVYGDDLIYPRKLHSYVVAIFTEMGFKLNLDKTFVTSPFRESCGSDWFKGVNVRPFSPEGQSQSLGRVKYAAFCYKLINGLKRRWEDEEIHHTLSILMAELQESMRGVFYVPLHWPDFSGCKVSNPAYHIENHSYKYYDSCAYVPRECSGTDGTGVVRVLLPHLILMPRKRFVFNQVPYLWDWLRSTTRVVDPELPWRPFDSKTTPVFQWSTIKSDKRTIVCLDGKRRKRRFATVVNKSNVARYEVGSASAYVLYAEEELPV